jgi:biopolymer transport protein TolR
MNRILVVCLLILGMQPGAAAAGSSFAGTWKGTMNNLPGIDLTIGESASKISGSVIFYFQERADVNSPWHVTADYSVPLLKPHVAGNALTFEVEHHVCHGCQELGPNVTFRMELAGGNEARLTRLEEDGTEGAQMRLVRSSQASTQAVPPLQAGISVEMPVTRNASPVPEADQEDALIVTVRDDGSVYLGVTTIRLDALAGELWSSLSRQPDKRLYIKADARAPYATVVKVIDTATAAGSQRTVLLTAQPESSRPETAATPNGFTIEKGCNATARAKLPL